MIALERANAGSITYIGPQGGDDGPGIRAQLAAHDEVQLRSGNYTVGASLGPAGLAALEVATSKRFIVGHGAVLKRADSALGPVIINGDPTGGTDADITIACEGSGYIDGNYAGNTIDTGGVTSWKNDDVLMVGVTRLRVPKLRVVNSIYCPLFVQAGVGARLKRIDVNIPQGAGNNGGIIIYGAVTDLELDGYYGLTYDDGLCLATHQTINPSSGLTGIFPIGGVAPGGTMDNITVKNMRGLWGTNVIRVFNGDNQILKNVDLSGITSYHEQGSGVGTADAFLRLGAASYPHPVGTGYCTNIKLRDFTGHACHIVRAGQWADAVQVIGGAPLIYGSGSTVGHLLYGHTDSGSFTLTEPEFRDLDVRTSGTKHAMMQIDASVTVANPIFAGLSFETLQYVLNNVGVVTGLTAKNLDINTLNGAIYAQKPATPETGLIDGVRIRSFTGTARYAAQMSLQSGLDMPVQTSADTAPAITPGSIVRCDSTLVLDGGTATAAIYMAKNDGSAWVRLASL